MQCSNVFVKVLFDVVQIRVFERTLYTRFDEDFEEIESENIDLNTDDAPPNALNEEIEIDIDDTTIMDQLNMLLKSRRRAKANIYDYCRCNDFHWFCTFTFDKQKIDRYSYIDVSKKMSQYMQNFKKRHAPDLQYILVPELHKDKAYHYHALIKNVPDHCFTYTRRFDEKKRAIYTLDTFKFGRNEHTKISDAGRASQYMTKYVTKDLMWHIKGKRTYYPSRGLDKPYKGSCQIGDHVIHNYHDYFKKIKAYHKICPVPKIDNTMHLYEFKLSDCPPELLTLTGLSQ